MNKNEVVGIVFAIFLSLGTWLGLTYMYNIQDREMAKSGLEECLETPDWSNSDTLWVKDCAKYMAEWKKVQDD
jgi:hypothetical protein